MKNKQINWLQIILDVLKVVAGAVFGHQVL